MALTAQKVPSTVGEASLARGLHLFAKGPCPRGKKRNMSLWGVDSSTQCLNSVQDWEGNLLLICSQHKAPRNRYLMQSGNDHTPCLGLCYCREHQNLKQSRFGGILWALLLCLLTLLWWMLWCLLMLASGLGIAGVSVEATDLYVTLECLWVFIK